MAKRLINAIGKGLGKTATDAIKGTAQRATRDIPSTKSFYNLGMGIGPFIRNTVQSYGQNATSNANDIKNAKANLSFAKENVVTQKNMASQLSALTSIMSDIRKISLAQLDLQRASINKRFGDRSDYLGTENTLENQKNASPKTTLSGTNNGEKDGSLLGGALGFIGRNPGIAASLLGLLALANVKNIKDFMNDTGLSKTLKEGTKAAVEGIAGLIASTIKSALLEGIPTIFNSIRDDLRKSLDLAAKGDTRGAIKAGTGAAATTGAVAGAVYGFRKGKTFKGKVLGAAAGGIAGFYGTDYLGNTAADAIAPDPTLSNEDQAAQKSGARQKLLEVLEAAGMGYGVYKLLGGGKSIPTAPPTGTTAPPTSEPRTKAPPRPTPSGEKPGFLKTAEDKVRERAARMAAEKNSKSFFGRTLALLRKLIEKLGFKRVMAFLALRFGLAAGAGATGFLAGPVGIITTILTVGWTLYEIYDVLSELDKESENDKTATSPKENSTPTTSTSTAPGATPTQTPAGTVNAGEQNNSSDANPSAGGDYANPAPKARALTGKVGDPRDGHSHEGIDLTGDEGSPISAVLDGSVITAGFDAKLGNYIKIQHDNGVVSKYGHLSKIFVEKGDQVKKGQTIGAMGNTGSASRGVHLHFEMRKGDTLLNPQEQIRNLPGSKNNAPGNAQNISGTQTAAPNAKGATLNNMMESTLGFDPSKLGVDMSKELSGESIAKLNAVYKDVSSGSAVVASALNAINNNSQSNKPAVTTPAAPAPTQKASETQSKEKDHLWMFQNQNSPYYG